MLRLKCSPKTRTYALASIVVLLVLGLAYLIGSTLTGGSRQAVSEQSAVVGAPATSPGAAGVGQTSEGYSDSLVAGQASSPDSPAGAKDVLTTSEGVPAPTGPAIIRTDDMQVQVKSMDSAVRQVRAAVAAAGAEIAYLSVQHGAVGGGAIPYAESARTLAGPASATITIRVDPLKLDALEAKLASIGEVLAQTSSSSDVTQEYVDSSARLKNLKAEEDRLRAILARASKVSDLLAVEAELSRVRGEIEAMQAQVDYLARQAAKATVTLNLSEPGPVIRPDSTDWGFGDAVTAGFQAAAGVLKSLITGLIALVPVALLAGLGFLVFRLARRVRRTRHTGTQQPDRKAQNPDD